MRLDVNDLFDGRGLLAQKLEGGRVGQGMEFAPKAEPHPGVDRSTRSPVHRRPHQGKAAH